MLIVGESIDYYFRLRASMGPTRVIYVILIRPKARPAQPVARVTQVCARSLIGGCVLPVLPGDDRC